MNVEKWLTINENGCARLTSGKSAISWNEISILLNIKVPDELFTKPRLEAKITIPQEVAVKEPISVDVIENVKEAIETATGLTFSINVIKEENDDGE